MQREEGRKERMYLWLPMAFESLHMQADAKLYKELGVLFCVQASA